MIDEHATYKKHGTLVQVSGPIACARRAHLNRITVTQATTTARAGPVEGPLHRQAPPLAGRARARRRIRFEYGRGRACAVETRTGPRVTNTRRWCEREGVCVPERRLGQQGHREDVCFTVNNIGDPIASTVRGTLFRSKKKPRSSPTALLLQHGAVSERAPGAAARPSSRAPTTWHGRSRGRVTPCSPSIASATRESPYERPPGSGALLTPDGYIEMTHQMVSQIRAGSHTDCAGEAAGRGAARVVLSGFSSGAAIVEGYATRHHDIDGIIPMSWSNQPQLSAAFQTLIGVLVPQLAAGKFVEFFLDGADDYSEFCERFLFYAPGMRDDVLRQLCGPDYYAETAFPTPSGETGIPALQAATIATIGNVGPTPRCSSSRPRAAFPNAEHHGTDPDLVSPEIAMWQDHCNCEVSVYLRERQAPWPLHPTGKPVTNRILEWLHDHKL